MSKKIGFIFLFSYQIPLKPFSEEEKQKYKNKILVHSLCLLSFIKTLKNNDSKNSCSILLNYDNEQSIYQILKTEFGIKSSYILDYNPFPRKVVKEKNTLIYSVILDTSKKHKMLNQINENICAKIINDNMMLFYSLDSICPEYPDIYTSIHNYYKKKNIKLNSRQICFMNKNNELIIYITLNDIIESLCGLEELREETKCYI